MNELLIYLIVFTILQMIHHEFMSRRSIRHFESITKRDLTIREQREEIEELRERLKERLEK